MTAQDIATALPYVIGGLFLLAVLLLLLALYQLRQGRRGPYWRLRRQAGQMGGRLFLVSMGLFVLALALAFYSGLAAVAFRGLDDLFAGRSQFQGVVVPTLTPTPTVTLTPAQSPTPTATPTVTLTATTVPTVTLPPSATPTTTATPTVVPPSATPTAIPPTATLTPTPTATYEQALRLTSPPGARTAEIDARLEIVASDVALSPNDTPVQPTTVFPSGITRLYFFITYTDMANGVPWSRVLYRDGVPVQGQTYLWSQGSSGDGFFFLGHDGGYEAGSYEVRLYVNGQEISRYPFSIVA